MINWRKKSICITLIAILIIGLCFLGSNGQETEPVEEPAKEAKEEETRLNVTITGIVRGTSTTDVIAISAGGTAYGVKAFDTVTNINIPSTVSSDNTVTVGFSDKIGLLNPITSAADVYKKKVNNADVTAELSGKVNTTYHTVDCATVVANEDMEIRYKSVLTI